MKKILYLAFFSAVCGCKHDVRQREHDALPNFKEISIEFSENDRFNKDQLSYEVVRLESCDDCLFGTISQLLVTEDGFYILDDTYTKSVFKFDEEGNFLYKIARHGKGPGEFSRPRWLTIDKESGILFVYDPSSKKILKYRARDGLHLGTIGGLVFAARSFEYISDTGFVFYTSFMENKAVERGTESFQVIFTDLDGRVQHTEAPFDKTALVTSFIGLSSVFSSLRDSVFLFTQYYDTLYYVSPNLSLMPAYALTFPYDNQKLADQYVSEMVKLKTTDFERGKRLRKTSGVFHLYRQYQTSEYRYLTGVRNGQSYFFLFDKSRGLTVDISDLKGIPLIFHGSDESFFYTALNPSASNKALFPDLREVQMQTEAGGNPILLAVKFSEP